MVAALRLLLLSLGFVAWLLGLLKLLLVASAFVGLLFFPWDRILGRLAGWAIARTPKAFRWTIEYISVRPSFSLRPHDWSQIVVLNWTWHNPDGFSDDDKSYILQIDRLTIRLSLWSIYSAIRYRRSVEVSMLQVEGLRMWTQRNQEAMLNLWEALDLPDSDVNVAAIVEHAQRHGGMDKHVKLVKPLPPVATEATRKAAKYWRPEWGRQATLTFDAAGEVVASASQPVLASASQSPSRADRGFVATPISRERSSGSYHEFPIGDRRRRPRWGVPLRFDIQQLVVIQVELRIFDLLTMDHRWRAIEPGDTKMTVGCLFLPRGRLEAGDERRSGQGEFGDGVRGVYLGEMIWVLLSNLLPKVLEDSPTVVVKSAAFACGFACRDSLVVLGARVLEHALDAKRIASFGVHRVMTLSEAVPRSPSLAAEGCWIDVHLIMGCGIAKEGQRVNVHARVELREPIPGSAKPRVVHRAESALKLWTKNPCWDERFRLGPVCSKGWYLRVACFHRKTRYAIESLDPGNTCDLFLGEVVLPLRTILENESKSVIAAKMMVGWFPLSSRHKGIGSVEGSASCETSAGPSKPRSRVMRVSRLKLGLRLMGGERLEDSLY